MTIAAMAQISREYLNGKKWLTPKARKKTTSAIVNNDIEYRVLIIKVTKRPLVYYSTTSISVDNLRSVILIK